VQVGKNHCDVCCNTFLSDEVPPAIACGNFHHEREVCAEVLRLDMQVKYDRLILIMDDDELEQFTRLWVERLSGYREVHRFAGPGDKGRDVVGFLTAQRHLGEWDNYQCKQYRQRLGLNEGLLAVGKVLYWASRAEFTAPRRFYFVAPKGLNQKLTALVDKPSEFKKTLVDKWDIACGSKIISGQKIDIDPALAKALDSFDYSSIHKITVDGMLADSSIKRLLFETYGADPGDYPRGTIPPDIGVEELKYLRALVDAYEEREKVSFADHNAVFSHQTYGPDLREHRERYFEADAFQKFYRDNTSPDIIATFRRDIHFGIKAKLKEPAADTLTRIDAVMGHASMITPAGPLAKYAYVPVKQGICHHLVNDEEISWKVP
jgi:hypothetical protein